jgi:hypothetical protein
LDCVYDNGDGTTSTKTGDCYSGTDNGFYFDGTVNQNSIGVDSNGDVQAQVDGSSDFTCSGDCPGFTFQTQNDPSSGNNGFFLGPDATGTISSQDPIHCAAARARGSSLASQARLQGDNLMSQAGQLVLDNTFSGIVDFYDTAKTATNAAPVCQGVLGTTQDFVLKQAFQNVGKVAAAQAARTVGNAKIGYDFLTFSYALFQCTF